MTSFQKLSSQYKDQTQRCIIHLKLQKFLRISFYLRTVARLPGRPDFPRPREILQYPISSHYRFTTEAAYFFSFKFLIPDCDQFNFKICQESNFFTNKKRIELSLTKLFSFGYNLNRLFDNNLLFLTKLPLTIKLKNLTHLIASALACFSFCGNWRLISEVRSSGETK